MGVINAVGVLLEINLKKILTKWCRYDKITCGVCRCDGIGRRAGLKIQWWRHRTGSTPVTGTSGESPQTVRLRQIC